MFNCQSESSFFMKNVTAMIYYCG